MLINSLYSKIGIIYKLFFIILIFFVNACAQIPKPGSPEAQQVEEEERVEIVETSTDEIPDWFLEEPDGCVTHCYSVATAVSQDLQMSLEKAVLRAKGLLADSINSYISGKAKSFADETGQGENTDYYEQIDTTLSNVFTDVHLPGYSVEKKKIITQGTRYRAYVRLMLPIGDANRVMINKIKKNKELENRLRASEAFKDLEAEIEKSRE